MPSRGPDPAPTTVLRASAHATTPFTAACVLPIQLSVNVCATPEERARARWTDVRAARALALAVALLFVPAITRAVGTAAGISITNTASVTADVGGTSVSASSAANVVVVAEVIDVDVSLLTVGNVLTASPASGQVQSYRVTNTGNGIDRFALTGDSTLVG